MNTREAMQALLDGKQITSDYLRIDEGGTYLTLGEDGHIYDADGDLRSLTSYSYKLYEEPNPHTPGTFAWAREEHKRGRNLHVTSPNGDRRVYEYRAEHRHFRPFDAWYQWEIDATNWEVIP